MEFYKHLAQVSTWSLQLAEEQLNMAATLSTPDALRYLLSDQCVGRQCINQIIERFKSENGVQNPLHVAAYCSGSEQIIETLIEALGDVDQVTDEKWTALHHAASHNAKSANHSRRLCGRIPSCAAKPNSRLATHQHRFFEAYP